MTFEDEEFEWRNVGKGLLKILISLIALGLVIWMIWFFAGHLSVFWAILKIIFWIVVVILVCVVIVVLGKTLLWGLNRLGAR